jgi:hypothetical protein
VGTNPKKEDGMKKFLCMIFAMTLFVAVAAPSFAADAQTVNGWVTDSKCGVKGAHAGGEDCAKKCIKEGAAMVVVTDTDQKVLTVKNPEALNDHVGHHVAVTGHIEGDTIHVESAKMI